MEGMVYADSAVLLQRERGNKSYLLETMSRLYLHPCDLSDEATVAEAIDSQTFSDFCGVDSGIRRRTARPLADPKPADKKGAQEKRFAQVAALLTERCLTSEKGTIVDFAMISASSSAKNKEKKQGNENRQGRKRNAWRFGYNAYIGVEPARGLVHTDEATPANAHDVTRASSLPTGEKDDVCCGSGYLGAWKHKDAIIRNRICPQNPISCLYWRSCFRLAGPAWQFGTVRSREKMRRGFDSPSPMQLCGVAICVVLQKSSGRWIFARHARCVIIHTDSEQGKSRRSHKPRNRNQITSGTSIRRWPPAAQGQFNATKKSASYVQVLGNDWHHPVWVASFRDRRIKGEPCG